ncbi:hypothetical protein K8Q93_02930 [Candidatus Parcubacteria bacterium]|nr:hypothetical protein [Candidatus Parcubacteria bacterium]
MQHATRSPIRAFALILFCFVWFAEMIMGWFGRNPLPGSFEDWAWLFGGLFFLALVAAAAWYFWDFSVWNVLVWDLALGTIYYVLFWKGPQPIKT